MPVIRRAVFKAVRQLGPTNTAAIATEVGIAHSTAWFHVKQLRETGDVEWPEHTVNTIRERRR